MLSFITYELLKSPHAYAMVRKEVDTVLQGKPIQPEHLGKLPYIVAVMREGLRLYPPAAVVGVTPFEDTVIGGKYLMKKGNTAALQIPFLHRDPLVWGEDAEVFRPERMLDGKFEALPVGITLLKINHTHRRLAESVAALWKWSPGLHRKQFNILDSKPQSNLPIGTCLCLARSHHSNCYSLSAL